MQFTSTLLAFLFSVLLIFQSLDAAEDFTPDGLVGKTVHEFAARDYRGRKHQLSDYAASPVVVLVFIGTECPLAKLYAPRLAALHRKFKSDGVTFLGINSNRQDSMTEISAHARRHGIQFPVLRDSGNQIADAIAVTRTPEVVVLDQKRVVRYHGRIDDQYGIGYIRNAVDAAYLQNAVEDVLARRPVRIPQTEVIGCFIGRIRKPESNSPVTYSNQVARILQQHCEECHREGEIAPFTLTTYEDAVGWADTILEVIEDQRMPPWHADPAHGKFSNARFVSLEEKQQIRDWVSAGSPAGDPAQRPPPRTYTQGWRLPRQPDFVVNMRDQPVEVPAEGDVRYQYFTVDPGFTEDKWIKAAELQPGNRAVVHHILVFARTGGRAKRGFTGTDGQFLAAYVPGYRMPVYEDGMGKLVPAGAQLLFQVHYTPVGTPQKDLSRLGLLFADAESIEQVVTTQQVAEHRGLVIPPGAENHPIRARSQTAPFPVRILSFMPHMHLRGKAFRYEVRYPSGESEILLDVPRYDFNWQTAYQLAKPKILPQGAYLQCVAHYDNSAENIHNPDPSVTVRWGDQTWEEMMIGYFDVAVPKSALRLSSGPGDTEVQIGGRRMSVQKLLKSINALDRNRDGRLEKTEVPARLQTLFRVLDADGDEQLTREEFQNTIRKLQNLP
ncbi:MAG: redoxin domain-containing protein [Planctomycetaceae bacterium]